MRLPEQARLGFCCKWVPPDGDKALARAMNQTTTTIAALTRRERAHAFSKALDVVRHNLEALERQLLWVASRPPPERMMRIISDMLPGYTHPETRWIYTEAEMRRLVEEGFARAGVVARTADVRLGMHPSQFCVLATHSAAALENSINELDYHTDIMRWLGLAGGWHPHGAHVNVHGGARGPGVEGVRRALARLSKDTLGLLTIENDEVSYGLDDLLPLADELPIVLDLYHHWIKTGGQYIEPDDPRIARIVLSWRGVRPVAHISTPQETLLNSHRSDSLPDFATLAASGVSPRKLRGHSHGMWNHAINHWVGRHLAWADFEVEAKLKNLAVADLLADLEPEIPQPTIIECPTSTRLTAT